MRILPYTLLTAAVLLGGCNDLKKSDEKNTLGEATADTAVVARTGATVGDVAAGAANAVDSAASKTGSAISDAFDLTKAKLADVKLPEVNLSGITVRGDADYQVYDIDEQVLFDTDKAVIKPTAAEALKQISESINKRYSGKDVRVLGFADSRGDKSYNRDLSKQRAEAVKNYLVTTNKMPADRLSTEAFGETMPAATNATAAGRKENRRVEIAVRVK
ncbi:OmpA family protein [Hymenobacter sp. H14-R3]|uniref:OmpA family protein n=1 Tax=Hymenobacter sp. H14-R3 TaxID=3046308 RepID=UPI0024B9D610|nr:OmpA family protein [Hymenobacter sp. H14-R3]MDJ0363552.1 OmpA family protein [Hymenobacter sp. H14-R3]